MISCKIVSFVYQRPSLLLIMPFSNSGCHRLVNTLNTWGLFSNWVFVGTSGCPASSDIIILVPFCPLFNFHNNLGKAVLSPFACRLVFVIIYGNFSHLHFFNNIWGFFFHLVSCLMFVCIILQRWDPISPQQRHGSSIVEVFRIVEEV